MYIVPVQRSKLEKHDRQLFWEIIFQNLPWRGRIEYQNCEIIFFI